MDRCPSNVKSILQLSVISAALLFVMLPEAKSERGGRIQNVEPCEKRTDGWFTVPDASPDTEVLCEKGVTRRRKISYGPGAAWAFEDCEFESPYYIVTCAYSDSKGVVRRRERFNNSENNEAPGWFKEYDESGKLVREEHEPPR